MIVQTDHPFAIASRRRVDRELMEMRVEAAEIDAQLADSRLSGLGIHKKLKKLGKKLKKEVRRAEKSVRRVSKDLDPARAVKRFAKETGEEVQEIGEAIVDAVKDVTGAGGLTLQAIAKETGLGENVLLLEQTAAPWVRKLDVQIQERSGDRGGLGIVTAAISVGLTVAGVVGSAKTQQRVERLQKASAKLQEELATQLQRAVRVLAAAGDADAKGVLGGQKTTAAAVGTGVAIAGGGALLALTAALRGAKLGRFSETVFLASTDNLGLDPLRRLQELTIEIARKVATLDSFLNVNGVSGLGRFSIRQARRALLAQRGGDPPASRFARRVAKAQAAPRGRFFRRGKKQRGRARIPSMRVRGISGPDRGQRRLVQSRQPQGVVGLRGLGQAFDVSGFVQGNLPAAIADLEALRSTAGRVARLAEEQGDQKQLDWAEQVFLWADAAKSLLITGQAPGDALQFLGDFSDRLRKHTRRVLTDQANAFDLIGDTQRADTTRRFRDETEAVMQALGEAGVTAGGLSGMGIALTGTALIIALVVGTVVGAGVGFGLGYLSFALNNDIRIAELIAQNPELAGVLGKALGNSFWDGPIKFLGALGVAALIAVGIFAGVKILPAVTQRLKRRRS